MPICPQCNFDSPAYLQHCKRCGNSFIIEPGLSMTQTQPALPPPTNNRKKTWRTFIPGFGTFGLFRQDPQTGRWGCAPGCLISTLLAVILVLGSLLFFSRQHPLGPLNFSGGGRPSLGPANLSISGNPTPGKALNIHGSNFPPGSSVNLTVDSAHYASTSDRLPIASVSISNIFIQERTFYPSDTTITVRSDGTFDTTITIPQSWTPGSRHVIQAQTLAKNGTATAQVQVTILNKQTETSPHNTPTTIATSAPPIVSPTATSTKPSSTPIVPSVSPVASPTINPSPTPTVPSVPPVASPTISPSPTPTATSVPPVAAPTVTSISPSSGPSTGGTSVVIAGTGFTNATSVSFGSSAVTQGNFTVNSDTQITVMSPAGSGTVDVTVTTASGTSITTSADQFTYNPPPPTVTSISPSSGPSDGDTSVIIAGTGFTNATSVSFGSSAVTQGSFTINSDTQITVTSPAGSGTVDTTVTTAGGTSNTSSADQFTYIPLPIVTSISPSSGSSAGGTSVVITGTGFTGATSVSFGGTSAASFTVTSDTQITATSPAGSNTVDVTVTTAGGTSATTSADQFTYIPPPTVTSISPSSGSSAGGTSVTITGIGFTGATSVSFGSAIVAQGNFSIDSDTQITVTSPAHADTDAGIVNVTVTTADGTSAANPADRFTYTLLYCVERC